MGKVNPNVGRAATNSLSLHCYPVSTPMVLVVTHNLMLAEVMDDRVISLLRPKRVRAKVLFISIKFISII